MKKALQLIAVAVCATLAHAQGPTTIHQATMGTFALEAGKGGKIPIKGLPSDTSFHVHSDFPVTVAIVSEELVPGIYDYRDLISTPCYIQSVLDYTLQCEKVKRPGMLYLIDLRKKREKNAKTNAVTVTRYIPDYSTAKSN